MTLLIGPGEGPNLPYAGHPLHVLAGSDEQPAGFAVAELTVPPHFAGPIPQAHDELDEAIYLLGGRLQVLGDEPSREAVVGSMFVAPRGHRHGFSNPYGETALLFGIWSPAAPALAFRRDVGAVLTADSPPDPGRLRDIYPPTRAACCLGGTGHADLGGVRQRRPAHERCAADEEDWPPHVAPSHRMLIRQLEAGALRAKDCLSSVDDIQLAKMLPRWSSRSAPWC